MNLAPRELAFLEHEMNLLKDDSSASGEVRMLASAILGKVEGEIEWEKNQHLNEVPESTMVTPK